MNSLLLKFIGKTSIYIFTFGLFSFSLSARVKIVLGGSVDPYGNKILKYREAVENGQRFIHGRETGNIAVGKPAGIETTRNYYAEGASSSVLIHEIFHNYAHQLKIDSGHNWLSENRGNWFASYRNAIDNSQDKKHSDYLWYELLLREQGNAKSHDVLLNRDSMWVPLPVSFKKAMQFQARMGDEKLREVQGLIRESDKAFSGGNKQEGNQLLQKALEITPDHPVAMSRLRYHIHWTMNQWEQAQKWYDTFLELYEDFNSTEAAVSYSLLYYMHRDPERVLSVLKRNGKNPPSHGRLTEYKLAEVQALKKLNRGKEAQKIALTFSKDPRNTTPEKFAEFLR